MYQERITTERRVRRRLTEWFGRGQVEQVLQMDQDVWMARLMDGGLAYATVEGDGSITIEEREVVC